ncbi:hypothetical protein CRX22_11440 [Salmonella enterica subsp. enterica serovar Newport]|nr:hypothetical protein [Salmonella enterica subsp. enterica serovar Newport]
MTYLLLLSLTAFISWPYYHRMRSFKLSGVGSYTLALIPSFFIAFGIVKVLFDLNNGTFIDFASLPDLLTKVTFVVVCCILTGVFCWLMFTSEAAESAGGGDPDGAFILAIVLFAVCVAQAYFVTDLIVKTIMEFS